MKKVLMVGLALLVSVAFVTAVFAQAPAKPAEKPAPAPKAPAPEKKAPGDCPCAVAPGGRGGDAGAPAPDRRRRWRTTGSFGPQNPALRPPVSGSPGPRGLPDPMVSIGYQNEGLTNYTYGDSPDAQRMCSVFQTLPFFGKRDLKERMEDTGI